MVEPCFTGAMTTTRTDTDGATLTITETYRTVGIQEVSTGVTVTDANGATRGTYGSFAGAFRAIDAGL